MAYNNEVYRVVTEGSEYRMGGYRNATRLFNTLKGARQIKADEERSLKRRNEWREMRGEEPVPVPAVKIQKARLVWEDVE